MLVTTQTTLALQCSNCDKLTLHALSRFNCSSDNITRINCECGTELVSISRKCKGQYRLLLICPICEGTHTYNLQSGDIWSAHSLPLLCEHTGVEIGFIGDNNEVRQCVKQVDRSLREIAEELGYDKYFINADIMYQVLELIRGLLNSGQAACSCGNDNLEMEICPDRVELSCSNCEATGIVFAETIKDLQSARELGRILLEANSYQYMERKGLKGKTRIKD